MGKHDIKSLRSLFLAGERSEPGIIQRYQLLLDQMGAEGALVVDKYVLSPLLLLAKTDERYSYWSTESGSPITGVMLNSAFPAIKPRPGSAGLPLPGMDLQIVDDDGNPIKVGEMGNIVLAQPLPPSALGTVWGNEGRFQECVFLSFKEVGRELMGWCRAYFDRFRGKGEWFDTGDAGVLSEDGYVSVLSRADDLIKFVPLSPFLAVANRTITASQATDSVPPSWSKSSPPTLSWRNAASWDSPTNSRVTFRSPTSREELRPKRPTAI